MENVLVTGGSGFIGRYIIDELLKQNYNVFVLVRPNYPLRHLKGKDVIIRRGDITDIDSLYEATKGMDVILHLAACVRIKDPQLNWAVNAEGTFNLVGACIKNKVKRIIHMSTITVLKKKKGAYGKSKTVAEWFFPASNLNYTIFRPGIILGAEGKALNNVLYFIKLFPFIIPMVGFGDATRQPIYIHDLSKTIVNAIPNKKTYRKTYPLMGPEIVTFRNLVRLVADELGIKKVFVPIPPILCKSAARFLELISENPVITSENVRSLLEDSHQDTSQLVADTNFNPVPLKDAVRNVLIEMGEKSG